MKLIKKHTKLSVLLVMMLLITAIGWVALSDNTQAAAPSLGETLIVGDANADNKFNVQDLVRIKRHTNNTSLAITLDGDLNVDGDIGTNDDVRCREMLVTGNHSLQVEVNESNRAKTVEEKDGYYTYYNLKKGLKAGQTITFKIELPSDVTNYGVYGFYSGSDYWVELPKNASASGSVTNTNTYRLVPNVNVKQVQIYVVNKSTNEPVAFRIYDIQVYADAAAGALTDMEVLYQQSTDVPVVFGTNDGLDLTKFSVGTDAQDLTYTWSLKKADGTVVSNNLNMTDTAYDDFPSAGTYTITATVNKAGYSGSASQSIYVVSPQVYIGYDNGSVSNTGASSATASLKGLTENSSGACTSTSFENYSGTVTYVPGIDGDANGALKVNRRSGAVTVVNGYTLPTNNFTLSTWFNKSVDDKPITTGSGEFLIGNADSDNKAATGFSITLKKMEDSEINQLRIKFGESSAIWVDIELNRWGWNNLTVSVSDGVMSIYMNGEYVEDVKLPKDFSFGSAPLAIGAYPVESGREFTYVERSIFFDDVQFYNSVLDADTISAIAASDNKGAEVIVDYKNNHIKNTGYSNATASAYKLNKESDSTSFVPYTGTLNYVDGFQKESGGAFKSNHKSGPYTVVDGYNFGTKNVTISTWFKIPTNNLSTGNSTYIIGTTDPDNTADGFRLTLRSEGGSYWFSFRADGKEQKKTKFAEFTFDEWHNVIILRDGANMKLYCDGRVLMNEYAISSSFSLGSESLALGAYPGLSGAYHSADIYYDDLRVYDGLFDLGEIKDVYSTKIAEPKVSVSYTEGSMDNAGYNSHATIGAYKLSQAASTTNHFVASDNRPFTLGAGNDAHGSFVTDHKDGSYIVVRDHVLGKRNFTISTWFNITDTSKLDTNSSGYYLFGLRNPNGGLGFSVCLRSSQIRFRTGSDNSFVNISNAIDKWESNKWYQMTLRREGSNMSLFLNGVKLTTVSGINSDYGTEDLAFGGYYGFANDYKDTVTLFDELRIYDVALPDAVIEEAAATTLEDVVAEVKDVSTATENDSLMYVNSAKRRAWDPGIIYLEEGPYAGTFLMYVAKTNVIEVSTSKDLANWSSAVPCYAPLEDTTWVYDYVWAPEIIYDESDGYYYLFYSAAMVYKVDNWRDYYKYLGVARSKDPTQGFVKCSDAPLFGTKGNNVATAEDYKQAYHANGFIDAHPFVDPKTGEKYMYMVRNRDGAAEVGATTNIIAVVKMKNKSWTTPDYTTYTELTKVGYTTVNGSTKTKLSEGVINEAPQMLYKDGKYYLSFSINEATQPEYAVVQAVGNSPMGPFTKLQPEEGGLLLGATLCEYYDGNKISGTGHHNFVQVDDELYIAYHQHLDPENPSNDRVYSLDRAYWTKNKNGDTILKTNGPTRTMQPLPSVASGYENVVPNATITMSKSNDTVKYLKDKLVKYNTNDFTKEYAVSVDGDEVVTMTISFDNYVKARALLLYNSYDYNQAFEYVQNITLSYRQVVDGVTRTGTMTLEDEYGMTQLPYNFDDTWVYDFDADKYLCTAAPMALEFNEVEINKVTIEFIPQYFAETFALSEVMVLGQEIPTPDVHVNYTGGTLNYGASKLSTVLGTYGPNVEGKFTSFVPLKPNFATGIQGDLNGALSMQHTKGAYTVVDDYNFGTNDFTISTWFNIPTTTQDASGGAGTYLFGNSQPDAGTSEKGFSICLKPAEVRFRVNGTNQKAEAISYAKGTWNNVTLRRMGTELKLYFNGKLVSTATIAADCNFGTKDLAFGGYYNNSNNYNANLMFFDEIQVYNKALSAIQIRDIASKF